jgi:hypothetical protein
MAMTAAERARLGLCLIEEAILAVLGDSAMQPHEVADVMDFRMTTPKGPSSLGVIVTIMEHMAGVGQLVQGEGPRPKYRRA